MLKLSLISVIFLYFFGSIRCETFSGGNFFIQWANLGDETQFFVTSTLSSSVNASNAWLAVGFALNNSNSVSNIVVCQNGANSGQSVSQYAGYGNQASLLDSVNTDTGLTDTLVLTTNGNLTCYFSRYNVLLVNQYIPVVDGSSFLFFTFGPGGFSSSYNASNIAMSNQALGFSTSNISSWTLTSPQTTTWTSAATTTKPGLLNQLVHNLLNSIFSLFSSLFK